MSLKRYIFLLIAFIILVLTTVQLSFVSYIQEQVNDEIQQTSQALSAQIIDFAQESLEQNTFDDKTASAIIDNESINQFYAIKVIPPSKQIIQINDNFSLEIDNDKPIIELTPHSNIQLETQDLKQLLSAIDIVEDNDNESFSLIRHTKDSLEQKTFEFQQQNTVTNRYFSYLFILTFSLAVFGIIVAYFMAKHISKPLKQLKYGFNALENGEFGLNLQEQGITETRKTLKQFNAMSERLAELNEQATHFAAVQHMSDIGEMTRGLAHALRNPINTIGLSIEQMAQPQLNHDEREKLAIATRDKITAMDNTIKSLLTLAADDSLTPTSFNLYHVIQDIVLEVSATSSNKINITADKTLPFVGHESEVRSIIHSITVNAIEASPDCAPIDIDIKITNEQLMISVVDQGNGISAQIKDKLFKPHITTKAEGAGMGLYIAKRLCQIHYQGNVTLNDNPSSGCIATITLTPLNVTDNS